MWIVCQACHDFSLKNKKKIKKLKKNECCLLQILLGTLKVNIKANLPY